MKSIYVVLIALVSLVVGYELHRVYPGECQGAHNLTMASYNFNPNTAVLRACKGTKTNDNYYYLNIVNYGADSVTVNAVDSVNMKNSPTVNYNGGTYTLTATHSSIDSIPMSQLTTTYYTLYDSTIYTRYGVLYGTDTGGKAWTFSLINVVSMQGQPGSVVRIGVVPIDMQE